ncbi:short-chain dehydrogenase/reductase family oxidoreductase [Mycobacterium xenopi 4042]|uniref:Short-chain dehydrogenase/reductase family oxidoreductase n=1 Tax=Mycobacterium xenopi 4042 TaxID=1299334 RepID=X8BFT9_MYCXE|nr:short-chain dehydrogenase/reductase family oxidoreductase [Mycobacterium xenopi 4042]
MYHTVRAALPSVIDRRGYVLIVSSLAAYAAARAWRRITPPKPRSSTSPTRCG